MRRATCSEFHEVRERLKQAIAALGLDFDTTVTLQHTYAWPMPSLSRRSERRRHENILREHFAKSSYATQLRVQTKHNTRIVLPVASTIARAEICLGC